MESEIPTDGKLLSPLFFRSVDKMATGGRSKIAPLLNQTRASAFAELHFDVTLQTTVGSHVPCNARDVLQFQVFRLSLQFSKSCN